MLPCQKVMYVKFLGYRRPRSVVRHRAIEKLHAPNVVMGEPSKPAVTSMERHSVVRIRNFDGVKNTDYQSYRMPSNYQQEHYYCSCAFAHLVRMFLITKFVSCCLGCLRIFALTETFTANVPHGLEVADYPANVAGCSRTLLTFAT